MTEGETLVLDSETNFLWEEGRVALFLKILPAGTGPEEYVASLQESNETAHFSDFVLYAVDPRTRRQALTVSPALRRRLPGEVQRQWLSVTAAAVESGNFNGALTHLVQELKSRFLEPEPMDAALQQQARINRSIRAAELEEKAKYARVGYLMYVLIGSGALVFCIWAYRYKRRYRELHTVNGVYRGIGSRYFEERYGHHYPKHEEDPLWEEWHRRGGGASGRW
ncbi:MAG: hypothetical protein EOO11_05890 [Chitinophagaceae bacterium]|nr:MAG: hypothetical protein EOO11_05890 [Chitinophagaceae bacterium]